MAQSTKAEIHLGRLTGNLRAIQDKAAPARVIPVVKADAYGHGAVPVAKRLVREGCDFLAVARLEEALELKESGIDADILILGRLFPGEMGKAARAGFIATVFGEEDVQWAQRDAPPRPLRVHLKIDTGMGRVGVLPHAVARVLDAVEHSPACTLHGIYSHFSTSDEAEKTHALDQLRAFNEILASVDAKSRGVLIHIANSGAILDIPESRFDAVRPGILLYGHYPSDETSRSVPIRQVMTLTTRVAHVRRLPAGWPVSYGRRFIPDRETTLAVLPIGYGDGIHRALTNKGKVLIRGTPYPMVGTVTMDCIMVDVGDDPVSPGDRVLLWGEDEQGTLQALDAARAADTIPYELTCALTPRVPRIYRDD